MDINYVKFSFSISFLKNSFAWDFLEHPVVDSMLSLQGAQVQSLIRELRSMPHGIYVCVYIYIYVCVCVCVYIYIYRHSSTKKAHAAAVSIRPGI